MARPDNGVAVREIWMMARTPESDGPGSMHRIEGPAWVERDATTGLPFSNCGTGTTGGIEKTGQLNSYVMRRPASFSGSVTTVTVVLSRDDGPAAIYRNSAGDITYRRWCEMGFP